MECKGQSYWNIELIDANYSANKPTTTFIKRQFHKARRRYDRKLIEEQLDDLIEAHKLWCDIFNDYDNRYKYAKV